MEHSGDPTKIHFNPEFISRGGALPKQKVHINPAFLQKSQGVHQSQQHVTLGASYGCSTGYKMPWQERTSWNNTTAPQKSASSVNTQDINTATNIYSYSSKSIDRRVVTSSHLKTHSLYTKSNVYIPYDKSLSTCSASSSKTHTIAPKPFVLKDLPSYSWKATNTSSWTSQQSTSSRIVKDNTNVSLSKESPILSQHTIYLNPKSKYSPSHRSFTSTNAIRRINDNPTQNPSRQVVKVKSEPKPCGTLIQDTGGRLKEYVLHVPKRKIISPSPASKVNIAGPSPKPVQLMPNQKWVSKNKVVNSSSKKPVQGKVDVKNTSTKSIIKTPKQKSNLKIMTKTKLVRTPSSTVTKSKVQQVTGHSTPQYSKTTNASPGVTTISRIHKASPATKAHQTPARTPNKKKYSVLSRTKLVRRQSLSGKAGMPGKPKYSVNTKNKLVRRRSNSGSVSSKSPSKGNKSKAAASKPETEKQKKFHVLSKTKIVRRRSSSGVYKALTAQGLAVATSSQTRKRAIVKRHKLVRNVSSSPIKLSSTKFSRSLPKKVNTAFKVVNVTPKLSTKQKIAKGIVSKYKINRLKLESHDGYKKFLKSPSNRYKVNRLRPGSASGLIRYKKFIHYPSNTKHKTKFNFHNKKVCASKRSDRFININGILYKSTKTSLKKQLPKVNKTSVKKRDSTCTVLLRGEKFHLTAGGRTLRRVSNSTPTKASLSRVHLGGRTYSRTRTGLYELTKTHHARAVLSSARQRSMVTLIHKRKKASFQKRNEYCTFFNRFGRCSKKDRGECPYIHDPSRVAICTRFLRGRCPVNKCPFSHTINPDKMPVCSHFLKTACIREDCPYRHVRVNPSAPVCLNFVKGHCKDGEECDKQHILICEEFKTGKCPRGSSCPLSHHKGKRKPRRVSFSKETTRKHNTSIHRKRKRSESQEVLGGPAKKRVEKRKQEAKPSASHKRYFHFMETDAKEDKDSQRPSEDCDKGQNISPEEERTAKAQSASDTQAECPGGMAQKSDLEETRSRLMKKVHKLKQSYTVFYVENEDYSDVNTDVEDCKVEPMDSNDLTDKYVVVEDCIDMEKTDSDNHRVQRPKLPKRLPSYIPLHLDCM